MPRWARKLAAMARAGPYTVSANNTWSPGLDSDRNTWASGEAGRQQHAASSAFDLADGIFERERRGRAAGAIHKQPFARIAPCPHLLARGDVAIKHGGAAHHRRVYRSDFPLRLAAGDMHQPCFFSLAHDRQLQLGWMRLGPSGAEAAGKAWGSRAGDARPPLSWRSAGAAWPAGRGGTIAPRAMMPACHDARAPRTTLCAPPPTNLSAYHFGSAVHGPQNQDGSTGERQTGPDAGRACLLAVQVRTR